MFVSVEPPIAFPLELVRGAPRGLGINTSQTAISTEAENSAAIALTTAAAFGGPAAPFLLAAAGIAKVLASLGVGAGCGQTCIQAANIVNQAEPALQANLDQYEAGLITQEQAQSTFNSVWQGIDVACSAIPGDPGQKCITDRQQGACTWKQTTDSSALSYPGEPQPGECWNWYSGYFVPLTLPPLVAASTSATSAGGSSALSEVGTAADSLASSAGLPAGSGAWLLLAAAAAVALMVIL